jgi:release factor glutamine methyltransferase
VLIPRGETEELVDLVLKKTNESQSLSNKNLQVIDIGTGSGCIAISLKLTKPNWKVFALDYSKNALAVARQNASELNANITWIEDNILNINNNETKQHFDVIISNPPYIKSEEKANMDKNVLAFEPAFALFVNDHQPLVFYEAIANFALEYLNPGGFLFFEINQHFGNEVTSLLNSKSFINIKLHKDINSNDRMISCLKPMV